MHQFRFHGRGGQGVVTTAEILATAAFRQGLHAQAFPMFGSERTGAPVASYCRIDRRPIRSHDPVTAPDVLVIQDPTLLHQVDVFSGVPVGATVLINSARSAEELGLADVTDHFRVITVPASDIARTHLGRPMPGAPLLAAVAEVTGVVAPEFVIWALNDRFSGAAATGNVAAARATHVAEPHPC